MSDHGIFRYSPADLCRMDRRLIDVVADERNLTPIIVCSCLAILAGSLTYGAVFGFWRSSAQAGLSALKLPLLIFSVTIVSSAINGMLAQALGSGLSGRQVCSCILASLAIASTLLSVLSPVMLFFVLQMPGANEPEAMTVYRVLLTLHTGTIGACGVAGSAKVYRLLRTMPQSSAVAGRILLTWILIAGLVGCELSWVLSPFLAKPGIPIPFINPDAFRGNFFEYLWRTVMGHL